VRRLPAALLAGLACTTACVLGPNYRRPDVRVPEAHRGQLTPAAAASLADAPWWEFFHDESLKALIDEALENNSDVRVAAWRV